MTRRDRIIGNVFAGLVVGIPVLLVIAYLLWVTWTPNTYGPVVEPRPSSSDSGGTVQPSPTPDLTLTDVPGGGPPAELRETLREDALWEECLSQLTQEECLLILGE
ncbi:hypothetical protein [Cellulosimicrobium cellulans]|uniref:hypothetical protein n=1 Tax=Cellulosimicrobium cellulans TaxID=1710 RepID=UPI001482C68C|nr:hypothetical protein [Cellulosimicrobium cellulans]